MKMLKCVAVLATFAFTATMLASNASAQATRTWVSGVGDDANPCSRTAPCKTFAGAISKTAASGEIDCLDPGGFGAVTITKAITLDCLGLDGGGVVVSGTNGIVVNAGAADDVQLIGLDINGLGPSVTSINGVNVIAAGQVTILNCLIYGFQNNDGINGAGVLVRSSSTAAVFIENTIIRDNTIGVSLEPQSGALNAVTIEHSVINRNPTSSVSLSGPGAVVLLNSDSLTGSAAGISNPSGGSVLSTGTNLIRNGGAPTQSVPLE